MSRWSHLARLCVAFSSLVVATALRAQITLVNASTYNGQTLADSIQMTASTYAYFTGGTTFTGPNATFANGSGIYWQQVGTLTGKTITLGNGAYLYVSGANNALTLDSATTVSGDVTIYSDGSMNTAITNQGMLTHNVGSGQIYASDFTNAGTITASGGNYLYLGYPSAGYDSTNTGAVTADGSGTYVYLRGNFDNNGTLTAQNSGNLLWDGANTTANLGDVTITGGGRALLNGTFDNTSATLTAPTGGSFELYGGTITNGTIASGALSFTSSGGYLDGASVTGDLNLNTTSSYVRFTNGANFTGANATFANSAGIYWQQTGTLTGKNITLGNGAYLYLAGTNSALTLDSTTTVTGDVSIYSDGSTGTAFTNQGTLTHNVGSGQIYASNFTNSGTITATNGSYLYLNYPSAGYSATNAGSVTADGSGTHVYLRGNFDNNGTLTAQNSGILLWDGANTTANLGNVTLTGGGRALLNGTLDNTSATLTAPTGGVFELYGGTISGGTIASGALGFTSSGGYLDGVTLNGDLTVANSAYVRFTNGSTFTGVNAALGASAGIYWQQVGTLVNNDLTLANGAYLYISGVNSALTLDAATTVTGDVSIYSDGSTGTAFTNQGTLTHNVGSGQIYASNFTNTGTVTASGANYLYLGYPSAGYNSTNTGSVTADGSGTYVYLRGNFDNNGTLTAQNSGNLLWDGSNTTANLGNVSLSGGGRALLNGTLDNTSATLTAPTGGIFELYGGTISGGTIAAGAIGFTSSGGYLDGLTLNGDLTVANSAYVRFTNGSTFTGVNAALGTSAGIYWQQVGTLVNNDLTLANGAYLYITGVNSALTLDAATTVTGDVSIYSDGSTGTAFTNEGTLTHNVGSGQIYASNFTNAGTIAVSGGNYLYLGYPSAAYNSTNTGSVTADGSGTYVYLRGNFDNNGTLTAQNSGNLLWDGANTTANLGNVVITGGGRALLNGTLDNTSATLTAPTGGVFELYGGTISGGTIASGALGFTSSGGYLNGVSVSGDLALVGSSHVYFQNGTTFSGQNLNIAANAGIYWQQSGTLTNKIITQGNGSYIYLSGANRSLTLDSFTSVTGDVSIYTDSSDGSAITNQGTLTHNVNATGYLFADNFTNTGTIAVSTGSLYLGYYSDENTTNAAGGVINQTGGNIHLYSPMTNAGQMNVQSGILYTNDYLTIAVGGLIKGAGTINGALNMAGGTLAPGNSIGTLTFASGSDFIVSGASTLEIELDATSADKMVFQNPGTIDVGAGLLQLSIVLLSAPTPYANYTLMDITSGGTGISGFLAGLPNNGDGILGYFEGVPYAFQVNYQANQLIIQAVPEPGTYALMGAGLAVVALLRRRRKVG